MPAYSAQELERATKPLQTDEDRGNAYCTLGHLLTEQREAYSADREVTIKAITVAVQDFDARSALGGTRPAAVASPPAQAPIASTPPAPPVPSVSTLAIGIAASRASMSRELARQGLIGADREQRGGGSVSMQAPENSMQRELRRAGLVPG